MEGSVLATHSPLRSSVPEPHLGPASEHAVPVSISTVAITTAIRVFIALAPCKFGEDGRGLGPGRILDPAQRSWQRGPRARARVRHQHQAGAANAIPRT